MGNYLTPAEDKLFLFMKHASIGIAETDLHGYILHLNNKASEIVHSFSKEKKINIVDLIAAANPELSEKIKNFIISDIDFDIEQPGISETISINHKNYFTFSVYKFSSENIIISMEEVADKKKQDKMLQQVILDKAVVQGKYEIASNILHDIGNAIVGFSSYLSRIKHSLEQDNAENLQNLVGFFDTQQTAMAAAIGEAKAGAVVKILSGIAQTQKTNQTDISKSVTEQQQIISHIQDILNIQREYVNGSSMNENRSTYLSSILKDCISMLFASIHKRDIIIDQNIPADMPAIKGDRTQLMQVILNILKNSIEAIDFYAINKNISITARTENDILILQIQDSGKGFDEATGKKIFTRGFTTKSSGTGLGLDHCRAILESSESSIDISSEGTGKGALTTIKFRLINPIPFTPLK